MDIVVLILGLVFYTIPGLYLIYRTNISSNDPLGYLLALFPIWNIVIAIMVFKKVNYDNSQDEHGNTLRE